MKTNKQPQYYASGGKLYRLYDDGGQLQNILASLNKAASMNNSGAVMNSVGLDPNDTMGKIAGGIRTVNEIAKQGFEAFKGAKNAFDQNHPPVTKDDIQQQYKQGYTGSANLNSGMEEPLQINTQAPSIKAYGGHMFEGGGVASIAGAIGGSGGSSGGGMSKAQGIVDTVDAGMQIAANAVDLARLKDTSGISNQTVENSNRKFLDSTNDDLSTQWGALSNQTHVTARSLRNPDSVGWNGAMSTLKSGMQGGTAGMKFGPIGAAVGAAAGIGTSIGGIFGGKHRAAKKAASLNAAIDRGNDAQLLAFNNAVDSTEEKADSALETNYLAYGGPLFNPIAYAEGGPIINQQSMVDPTSNQQVAQMFPGVDQKFGSEFQEQNVDQFMRALPGSTNGKGFLELADKQAEMLEKQRALAVKHASDKIKAEYDKRHNKQQQTPSSKSKPSTDKKQFMQDMTSKYLEAAKTQGIQITPQDAQNLAAQAAHESGYGTSSLANRSNNYWGLTGGSKSNNGYKSFASVDQGAGYHLNYAKRHGLLGAKSTDEYAQRAKAKGYYGDSEQNYAAGLRSAASQYAYGGYLKDQEYDLEPSEMQRLIKQGYKLQVL